MRILHLLSQIEVTGAEVYAITLTEYQLQQGHQVWLASDKLHLVSDAHYLPLNLHKRTILQRIKNILAVRKIIQQYQIEVVHAHSRATIWVGYFATLFSLVPLISSIHGRQKSSWSKRHWDMYGDKVIAICDNAALQMQRQVKINPRKLIVIPNAIKFPAMNTAAPVIPVLTIAGRTTGPKGIVLEKFIHNELAQLLQTSPQLKVQIIGGDIQQLSATTQNELASLSKKFPQQLVVLGFVNNLVDYLAASSCVIGAGRIAIKALSLGVPVIAIGEAFNLGLITTANLSAAIATNFADIAENYYPESISFTNLATDIERALNQGQIDPAIIKQLREYYAFDRVGAAIIDIYRGALLSKYHPQHIPILMYHKVLPEAEHGQHKTYVTCEQFAQQMAQLANNNFTPITFKDYFAYRDGHRPLAQFPRRPIILTFDDGYQNNLQYAVPILQQHQFTGVIFALGNSDVTTNYWDTKHGEAEHVLLTTAELKQLAQQGIEIGAHSLTHRDLTQLTSAAAYQEIHQSKVNLETIIGETVISFAYPYGRINDHIKTLVQQAGFKCAVATDTGGRLIEDDKFAIFRVNIMPRDYGFAFWKKTQSWYRARYWRKRGQ